MAVSAFKSSLLNQSDVEDDDDLVQFSSKRSKGIKRVATIESSDEESTQVNLFFNIQKVF